MGTLGQLGEGQGFHAVGRELAVDPVGVFTAYHVRVGLAAVRALAPDFQRRRPQAVVEQYARGLAGGVAEVVSRVGRRRCRGHLADPARVAQHRVLFGLAHDVGVAAGGQFQLFPVGFTSLHFAGGQAEEVGHHQRLGSGHTGAQLDTDVAQRDVAIGRELDAGHRRLGAGAEVLLADGEADAVPVVRVLGVELLFARVAVFPDFAGAGLFENLVQAHGTGRHGTLGVFHAREQHVLLAQVDGIDAQAPGDFVHHHFGGGHALQSAVTAHGTGLDATGVVGGGLQVALRHVVDRLRGRGADGGYRCAVVDAAAAVHVHLGTEDLEAVVVLVHGQLVADVERVTLDAALELFVAVIGQAYWHTGAVQRGQGCVVDEDVVVLGAVADRVAGVHVELGQAEARRRDHLRGFGRGFQRALGGDHEMQGLARRVVPTVAVVRFQGGRFDRRRLVALVEHQPVFGRCLELLLHALGIEHAALVEVAMQVGLRIPLRATVADHREQNRILEAGEFVFIGRGRATDAHVTEAAVGFALVVGHLGAVADGLVIELELVLGLAEALEVVPDQDRHRVADEHRHLAGGQQRVGGMLFGEDNAVFFQVVSGDDAVGLQLGTQPGEVIACVDVVGAYGLEQHGVALLLRPAGHVLGADVAGEYLAAADLGQGVVAKTRLAVVAQPFFGRHGDAVFHQRSQGRAAQGGQGHADASDQPALQK
ncbi:hypothetical protein D3C84_203940 [compost metagenome]